MLLEVLEQSPLLRLASVREEPFASPSQQNTLRYFRLCGDAIPFFAWPTMYALEYPRESSLICTDIRCIGQTKPTIKNGECTFHDSLLHMVSVQEPSPVRPTPLAMVSTSDRAMLRQLCANKPQ
jgi:hypothetical protein